MKARLLIKTGFLLHLAFYFLTATAQEPKLCGTVQIDTASLNKALQFEKMGMINKVQASQILLRVFFHIIRYDDGNAAAASLTQINTEFNTLVAAYSADNICFLNAGVDYINNSYLDTGFIAGTHSPAVFDPYRVPGCVNVFYSMRIKGNNAACGNKCGIGGTSFKIPNTFCLISNGNIGSGQTIAHEVGHCMGLLHTFEPARGFEDIDGSNATSTGDLIADTPADPYAYNSQSCFATLGCLYNGTCKDPKNQSNFSPPYTNLMAYWWSLVCYPSLALTNDQYTRLNSFLSTNTDLQNCQSTASVNISNVNVSSGYYMQSAVNTLIAGSNTIFSGSAKATLGGGLVLIEPGFHVTPNAGGLILIRTKACIPQGATFDKTENKKVTAFADISKNEEITANSLASYPNPTSSLVNLAFNILHHENNAVIKVYDMNGHLLKEVFLGIVLPGKHKFTLDLGTFNNGIYAIALQLNSSFMKTVVVLAKR